MLINTIKKFTQKINFKLLLLLVLALIIRLVIHSIRDLWWDEVFTSYLVNQHWLKMFDIIIRDVHPPLYYIFLKIWCFFFGISPLGLRSFSILCGLILITIVYSFISKITNNKKISYIIAFILAINPFFVDYSLEARPYMLSTLLASLTLYFFYLALTNQALKTKKYWLSTTTCLGLLFLTHYLTSMIIAIFLIFIYIYYFINQTRQTVKQKIIHLITISIPAGALFFAWLPGYIAQSKISGTPQWIPQLGLGRFVIATYGFLFGVYSNYLGLPGVRQLLANSNSSFIIGAIILILIFIGSIVVFKSKNNYLKTIALLSFLLWIVPMLSLLTLSTFNITNLFVERYVITSAFFFIICIALILSVINKKTLYAIVIIYALLIARIYITAYPINHDYTQVASFVQQNFKVNNNNVYVTAVNDFEIMRYYLRNTDIKIYLYDTKYNSVSNAYNNEYEGYKIIQPTEIAVSPDVLRSNDIIIANNNISNVQFSSIYSFYNWKILTK
ncbi:MAG: glycosyltransferase family 39 protein [Patescibacteria group bacterium]